MSQLSPKGLTHYRKLLDFIEEQEMPRVIADFVSDTVKDVDYQAGVGLDQFNNLYFDTVDKTRAKQSRKKV